MIWSWMIKKYRNIKFKTKILTLIGMAALIPTVILFAYSYDSLSSLQSQEIDDISHSFDQQMNSINQRMSKTTSNILKISTNSEIQSFFCNQEEQGDCILRYVTVIRPLLSYMWETGLPEIRALRFYTKNEKLFSNLTVQNINKIQNEDFFSTIQSSLTDQKVAVNLVKEARSYYGKVYSSSQTLSAFTEILTPDSQQTFMECELSFDEIYQNLSFATNNFNTTDYLLLYKTGDVLFSSDTMWIADARNVISSMDAGSIIANKRLVRDGKTYVLNASTIDYVDCVLMSFSDLDTILAPIQQGWIIFLLVVIACISAGYAVANALVNKLLQRVDTIDSAICKIQKGNFDIHIKVLGNDFIDKVSANLNTMAQQIQNLIKNNYENKLQCKNLEIRMLTQQISPHFLYNTLECLKMRAVLDDETEMAQALTSLGRLLRYYADYSSEMSTVHNEVDRIVDYVNIIKLIEGRRCILEMDIEPSLLSQKMPSFILQPFVENSIKYGLSDHKTEIIIRLCIWEDGTQMQFSIQDNGAGIQAEIAAKIQMMLADGELSAKYGNRDRSIGLCNTNARMKLIYGQSYGVSFESEYGHGTTIRFQIPFSP